MDIETLLKKRADRIEITDDEFNTLVDRIGRFTKAQLLQALRTGDADYLQDVARDQLKARSLTSPQSRITPALIVVFFAMVFAAIAAWPVVRDWLPTRSVSYSSASSVPDQPSSDLPLLQPKLTPTPSMLVNPYESESDFAKYAADLRQQAMLKAGPQVFAPVSSNPSTQRYPWNKNIVTTVFWIGKNGKVRSAWDDNWQANYGGVDTPDAGSRRNYIPASFVPRQNPFYVALPYNDVTHDQFKPEAAVVIPWFKQSYTGPGQSVCKGRWLAIRKGNRVCYAQWEDCGPSRSDQFQYVFQNERPKPNAKRGAGLSVSPAIRDYLDLQLTDLTDWQFVEVRGVPAGPWRNYGDNNHFVIAQRQFQANQQHEHKALSDTFSGPQFGLFSMPYGRIQFEPSSSVPLIKGQMYGWRLRINTERSPISVREEFELPKVPVSWGESVAGRTISEDGKTSIITHSLMPDGEGYISNVWTIAPGDPLGRHVIRVFIDDALVATFDFVVTTMIEVPASLEELIELLD